MKENFSANHLAEKFQTHPCHSHRYEDLKKQITDLLARSEETQQQVILKSVTDEDRKTVKELNDRYKKLRPLITQYIALKQQNNANKDKKDGDKTKSAKNVVQL